MEVSKADRRAVSLADGHYSRQRAGSREIGPPGQKIVMLTRDGKALWGSHRPAPWSGLRRADGFGGYCCFIFRNTGGMLSSMLVREAVGLTALGWGVGAFTTYIGVWHVESPNPGYCFLKAGFTHLRWVESKKLGLLRQLEMGEGEVEICMGELNG